MTSTPDEPLARSSSIAATRDRNLRDEIIPSTSVSRLRWTRRFAGRGEQSTTSSRSRRSA